VRVSGILKALSRLLANPTLRRLSDDELQDFMVTVAKNRAEFLFAADGFLVPLFERDWRVPLKQELGIDYRLDPTHCTEYTLESFASEMKDAGLKVTYQEVRWGEIWAEAVSL
jgi:hypothetical protein